MPSTLQQQFGEIDIYLFDQLLRGNITPGMRLLDAGCGYGRNLVYLLQQGFAISAVDQNPDCIAYVQSLATTLQPALPPGNIRIAPLEHLPFAGDLFDVVLCNSVLHFARDEQHFLVMLAELWRVLRPGGLFFCRLGSTIGASYQHLHGRIFRTGDGSEWFLVDESMLLALSGRLQAHLLDPLKTTVVQDHRSMTTWVLRKSLSPTQAAA